MASGFSTIDFIIFGAFLGLSVGIGIYHAWKSRRNVRQSRDGNATSEFLMGNRKMPVLPTALSLLTTFLSGITLLGTPAEIYQRGLLFWVYYMMAPCALLFSSVFFLPVFYRLRYISIFEYFQHRFGSRLLRFLTAILFLVNTVFYMSVVLYAPAVALSGVTSMKTWPFILAVGLCCTIYTSIGGLKAVVWTDTLQAVFMYGGLATLIIKSTIDAGGIAKVFEVASETGRIAALGQIDPNPAQHNSLWISLFGAFCLYLSFYGLNQMAVQRYCSLPTFRDVKIAVGITMPAWAILGSMAVYIGLVMLAYFIVMGRNPMTDGSVTSQDQLVILFANDVLGIHGIPGLPGLFLACLFSSTLSTISSGLNSMAAVTWEDLLKGFLSSRLNDNMSALLNKVIVVIYGCMAVGLAFLAGPMGGIIRAGISMLGAFSGPLVGLFMLGMFVPKASSRGAFLGLIVAAGFNIWICLGSFISKPYAGYALPINISEPRSQEFDPHYGNREVFYLYRISGFLYPTIGIVLCLLVGGVTSIFLPDWPEEQRNRAELTFCGQRKAKVKGVNADAATAESKF